MRLSQGVKDWLARHHAWLPWAGVVMVLLTWIVKDELNEQWSRFAEEIDVAQYIFSIKTDTLLLKQRLPCIGLSDDKGKLDKEYFYRCEAESAESNSESTLENIKLL